MRGLEHTETIKFYYVAVQL